jgi:hypothetical protein
MRFVHMAHERRMGEQQARLMELMASAGGHPRPAGSASARPSALGVADLMRDLSVSADDLERLAR